MAGRGAVDVGVVMNPAPERSPVALGSDVWVAVLAQAHPLGRRVTERGIALDELAGEPFILATGGCTVNGQRLMEDAGLQLSDVRITVRDWASACVLVHEGLGVSLVPESTLPSDRQGLRVLPVAPAIRRVFGLVRSRAGHASRATQVFMQAVGTAAAASASGSA